VASVRFASRKFRVPGTPAAPKATGTALIVGGVLGFLPVVGFWMVPLGVAVLSVDSPRVRRVRRRTEVWWGRRGSSRTRQG